MSRLTRPRLPLAVASATLLSASAALAQTPAPTPPPTIDACYVPASGTIYRIDTPASPAAGAPKGCLGAAHVKFTWNQQGPAGPKGDKGDAGAAGAAGVVGPDLTLAGKLSVGTTGTFGGALLAGEGPGVPIPATGGKRLLWAPQQAAVRAGAVSGDQWGEQKLGQYSAAFGNNTTASAEGAFAAGVGSSATGAAAVAIGRDNAAGNDGAVALGRANVASGQLSVALGSSSTASGTSAIAIGSSAQATGGRSVAIGTGASTAGQLGAIVIADAAAGAPAFQATVPNELAVRATGGVRLRTSADLSKGCTISVEGALACSGPVSATTAQAVSPSAVVYVTSEEFLNPANGGNNGSGAVCPSGHRVIGGAVRRWSGGGAWNDGHFVLNTQYPSAAGNAWVASVSNFSDTPTTFKVIAICLRVQ